MLQYCDVRNPQDLVDASSCFHFRNPKNPRNPSNVGRCFFEAHTRNPRNPKKLGRCFFEASHRNLTNPIISWQMLFLVARRNPKVRERFTVILVLKTVHALGIRRNPRNPQTIERFSVSFGTVVEQCSHRNPWES